MDEKPYAKHALDTVIPLQKTVTDVTGCICEDEYLFDNLDNKKQIQCRKVGHAN